MINTSKLMVLVFVIFLSFVSCNKDEKIAKDIYNRWEIVDFISLESVAYSKNNNYNPIIQFHKEGNYMLELDKNSCMGSFNLSFGNTIEISAAGCTKLCCDSKFSEKITSVLSNVESYEIDNNKMKLKIPEWGWINLVLND